MTDTAPAIDAILHRARRPRASALRSRSALGCGQGPQGRQAVRPAGADRGDLSQAGDGPRRSRGRPRTGHVAGVLPPRERAAVPRSRHDAARAVSLLVGPGRNHGLLSRARQVPSPPRGATTIACCQIPTSLRPDRAWMDADFEPHAVSRAELAWWVARRVPGEESPEHVGRLIAEENALIFGIPPETVLDASVLRARAGRLRDEGGDHADWDTVSRLLHESYQALHAAVNGQ